MTTPPTKTGISPEEVTILACLLTGDETVRLWARRMGIPSTIMSHDRLRELYDSLLMASQVAESSRHMQLIERPLPATCAPHASLWTATEYFSSMPGFEARLQFFQRAVRLRLQTWAPEILRFIAKRIEQGNAGKEVQHAAELLAFAAWQPLFTGPWVYRPGEEVKK